MYICVYIYILYPYIISQMKTYWLSVHECSMFQVHLSQRIQVTKDGLPPFGACCHNVQFLPFLPDICDFDGPAPWPTYAWLMGLMGPKRHPSAAEVPVTEVLIPPSPRCSIALCWKDECFWRCYAYDVFIFGRYQVVWWGRWLMLGNCRELVLGSEMIVIYLPRRTILLGISRKNEG